MVLPATVADPLESAPAGWKTVREFPAPRTAKPSAPPAPPVIVPKMLPPDWNVKASLVDGCPVRFSKPAKAVPSTLPAFAPVTVQAVWSCRAAGPMRVSADALPTTLVIEENAEIAVPLAVSRLTLTGEPRV